MFDLTGLETYRTDTDRESKEGVWLVFPGNHKIKVLRAGGSNEKFVRLFSNAIKPFRRQMDRGTLDPAKSNEIMIGVYVDSVILDWEGFKDTTGAPIPYSKQAARELLQALPELFNDIVNFASDAATFQQADAEEVAKELGES